MRKALGTLTVVLAVTAGLAAQARPLLDRMGSYVEAYYARTQSILASESVTLQPLRTDFSFDGFPRRLVYDLRFEWDPDRPGDEGPARVVRELVSVNGRPPRPNQKSECIDPRSVSPEPLAFLLPDRRERFIFHPGPLDEIDGQTAAVYEYRSVRAEPPRVEWKDECVSIDLPGRSKGRVWADPETAAILRVDEQLTGMVDIPVPIAQQRKGARMYLTVERADSSIRYRPVTFTDPDETVLLPSVVDNIVVFRNAGTPRMRITQRYTDYRRFVTGGRLVR